MFTKLGEISLQEFNPKFRKTISGYGNTTMHEAGVYHTIWRDNKKVGIIGYIPRGLNNFEQIAILPKYRGQGLTNEASLALMKLHKLKKLTAHIDDDNIASIKAHEKAKFKRNLILEKKLRKDKKIPETSKLYTRVI